MEVYSEALGIIEQRLQDTLALEEEYRSVVMRDQLIDHTVEQSQGPENGPRNRYGNVLPYDYNRVKLSSSPSYVNASHVCYSDTPNGLRFNYIATQGPLTGTVEEFWRMCLEQGCTAVVMLTNLVERGMAKCAPYFPTSDGEVISTPSIEVRTLEVARSGPSNELTIRHLEVAGKLGDEMKVLKVNHYHYHAWPDHGTPEESIAIRSMCNALLLDREHGENIVVHCSAGIGRTGTFMVIDIVRLRLQKLCESAAKSNEKAAASSIEQALAIPGLVHQLRQQRMGMVQTVDQYLFIYHTLREELLDKVAKGQAAQQQQQQQATSWWHCFPRRQGAYAAG